MKWELLSWVKHVGYTVLWYQLEKSDTGSYRIFIHLQSILPENYVSNSLIIWRQLLGST